MTTHLDLVVAIDRKAHDVLRPVADLPHAGTLAFLPDGNLLVLHRTGASAGVVAHEYSPTADGAWAEARTATLKGVRGSPIGCAVSADGARLAAGTKKARLYDWPGAAPGATLTGVRYQLERNSLGFSPSGARVVVADGGYVAPRNRVVSVCDASTGAKIAAVKTDEWAFVWAAMPDESTVLTVGLAHDWVSGEDETDGQRVLGCYDVDTGKVRWRRVLRADQLPCVDPAAGRLWVAGDEAPYVTKDLLALSIADGSVLRTIGLDEHWRPGAVAPVMVGRSTLALAVSSYRYSASRYVVIDVDRGVVLAELGPEGATVGTDLLPAAHAGTRRVAATVDGSAVVWQLP